MIKTIKTVLYTLMSVFVIGAVIGVWYAYAESKQEQVELETQEIEIVSANKIADNILNHLSETLNCKIHLTVNPDIIGGVQLRQGNKIFDNSVSYQLNQLKNTLYNL